MDKHYSLAIEFTPQKEWRSAPMWAEMSFGGIGGGIFLISALFNYPVGIILGYLLLVAGKGIFLLAHFGKPTRFLKVFLRPFASWISFGAWGFLLFAICGLLYTMPLVIFINFPVVGIEIFRIAAIVFAVVLIVYDGLLLASSVGISSWSTGMLPALFGVSALTAGLGGVIALIGFFDGIGIEVVSILKFNAFMLLMTVIFAFTHITILSKGAIGAKKSTEILTKGDERGGFIGGAMIFGLIVPLIIVGIALSGVVLPAIVLSIAGILEVLGAVFLRSSVLKAGVYTPII